MQRAMFVGELNLPFAEPLNCAVFWCVLRKMVFSNEASVWSSGTWYLTRLLIALCTFWQRAAETTSDIKVTWRVTAMSTCFCLLSPTVAGSFCFTALFEMKGRTFECFHLNCGYPSLFFSLLSQPPPSKNAHNTQANPCTKPQAYLRISLFRTLTAVQEPDAPLRPAPPNPLCGIPHFPHSLPLSLPVCFPSQTPERRGGGGGVEEVLTASFAAPQGTSKPVFVAYAGENQRRETRGQLLKSATCICTINIQRGLSVTRYLWMQGEKKSVILVWRIFSRRADDDDREDKGLDGLHIN